MPDDPHAWNSALRSTIDPKPTVKSVNQGPDSNPADLSIGAFSEAAPWIIEPANITWLSGIDSLRRGVAREIPIALKRPRTPPIGRFFKVVGSIGLVLLRWYLFDRGKERSKAQLSEGLRKSFERLGSTFVKLGQIISGGEGLFPEELVAQFRLLRDRVPAESFDDVRTVVEAELGRPISAVFEYFDQTPLAAASIAQVHAARLRTGEEVVVKVQRPRVQELVRKDIATLSWLAPFFVGRIPVAALANPPALVELFAVLVSAGESPSTALQRVSTRASGVLAEKFIETLGDLQRGKNLTQALERLGLEVNSTSIRRFCDTLILAMERGTSLSDVLTRQVEEVRTAHHATLMTAAGKAEIALMIPVIFLILPISVLFALWPSYLSLGQSVM